MMEIFFIPNNISAQLSYLSLCETQNLSTDPDPDPNLFLTQNLFFKLHKDGDLGFGGFGVSVATWSTLSSPYYTPAPESFATRNSFGMMQVQLFEFLLIEIWSYVAFFSSLIVRSTTDTSTVGTRKAIPVSLPFNAHQQSSVWQ